jgi:hypothetical protein
MAFIIISKRKTGGILGISISSQLNILLIMFVVLYGCSSSEKTPPEELIGIWETEAPRYDGCSIEINSNHIIFSNIHEDHIESNMISKIKKSLKNGEATYDIDFSNKEGLEFSISFVYMKTSKHEIIHYKNQRDVKWIKTDVGNNF